MGCGSSHTHPYRKEEIDEYLRKQKDRFLSAELIDGKRIKLISKDGFYNSSSLLDRSWLQGRMTNEEYTQSIEHINQRVAQAKIGQSKSLSIDQIPTTQSTKLAISELNSKYQGKVRFSYEDDDTNQSDEKKTSFIFIDFP